MAFCALAAKMLLFAIGWWQCGLSWQVWKAVRATFAHTYAPGELVIEDERVRLLLVPPTVSGEFRQKLRRVDVSGKLSARLQLECDRRLKPVELPVYSRFKLEYVTAADYREQQAVELSEEDLDVTVFDGETIDVDDLVTEELPAGDSGSRAV